MTPNLRGSLLMIAAMAGFAVADMFLKTAARDMPVGQILMIFGAAGMVGFAILAKAQGARLVTPALLSPAILARAGCEVTGRLFYTLALALTPLSSASAILQAAPLVVVAGAALIFGERVGWRRWSAIAAGFVGVMVILRPGLEGFTPLSILAVLGMLGFAGRDLATRAAPKTISNLTLGVYGFAMMVPTGAALLAWTRGGCLAQPGPCRSPCRGHRVRRGGLLRADRRHAGGRDQFCQSLPLFPPDLRDGDRRHRLRGNRRRPHADR